MSKYYIVAACMVISLAVCSGCGWMGETAGRAKAGVENAIDNTKEGYSKGYEEGKKINFLS